MIYLVHIYFLVQFLEFKYTWGNIYFLKKYTWVIKEYGNWSCQAFKTGVLPIRLSFLGKKKEGSVFSPCGGRGSRPFGRYI
jgi:hypothetical protein